MNFTYKNLGMSLLHIEGRYLASGLGSWDGSNSTILRHISISKTLKMIQLGDGLRTRRGRENT